MSVESVSWVAVAWVDRPDLHGWCEKCGLAEKQGPPSSQQIFTFTYTMHILQVHLTKGDPMHGLCWHYASPDWIESTGNILKNDCKCLAAKCLGIPLHSRDSHSRPAIRSHYSHCDHPILLPRPRCYCQPGLQPTLLVIVQEILCSGHCFQIGLHIRIKSWCARCAWFDAADRAYYAYR